MRFYTHGPISTSQTGTPPSRPTCPPHTQNKTTHARTPHPRPNQPAFATRARPPGNRRPLPFPIPYSLSTTSLRSPFPSIPAAAISPRRLRRRGGRRRRGSPAAPRDLNLYAPFLLALARISCLLTLSSESRSQTRLIRGEDSAAAHERSEGSVLVIRTRTLVSSPLPPSHQHLRLHACSFA
jgi:hypothetical protein